MQELQMGTLLKDRYRVLRPLGEGGMGQVYLGEDEHSVPGARLVAIKALRVELREKTGQLFLRRFKEEAQILQRVNAPGVPAFVDAFEHESRSILIMEYIEGNSLADLLDRSREQQVGGLPAWLVAEVGIQVCRVLEHLHGQTPPLIHRDIKPPNIIIRSQDDLVFLVDFGLAREFHEQSQARTLVGTVGYCPLEQYQGQPEPRSDLYALGATMFELVTGCIPRSLNIPPVQSVLPSVHQDLARVINLCIRTTPVERPTDATCLRMLLEEAQHNLESGVVTPDRDTLTGDRISELIHRWGRGRAVAPAELEPIPPLPEPLKLKRLAPPRRWPAAALKVLLLLTLPCIGLLVWGRECYVSEQRELVKDALPEGVPHAGWRLEEAQGLFPAEGLGLGEPGWDWSSSQHSGVVFGGGASQPTMMNLVVRRLKGEPRLLVFCRPLGVLLEPRKEKYELRVVRLAGPVTLRATPWEEDETLPKVSLGAAFRRLEVRLSLAGPKGQLWVDKRPPLSFEVENGSLGQCGVVLLNAVKKTRCVVEEWQVR